MAKRWILLNVLMILQVLAFLNCSGKRTAAEIFPFSNSINYFQNSNYVTVEVHYEPGAEPFAGTTAQGRDWWSVLEDNLTEIFKFRRSPPQLNIPKALSDMHAVPAQNKTQWSVAELYELYTRYRLATPTSSEARFYVFFVKGYYNDGSGVNTNVLGLRLGGTPVIAMFKDVIQNSGLPNGAVVKFVEQSTMVHEMGHALGFVNLGVPMVNPHEDTAHPGHTTNPNCVMYWQNEGFSDMAQFIQKYLASSSVVMWGPEVLADAKAVSR